MIAVELQGADNLAAICERPLGHTEIEAYEVVAMDDPREDMQLA